MRSARLVGVLVWLSAGLIAGLIAGVRLGAAEEQATSLRRIDALHLPNVVRVHAKVMSGGAPDGDEGFRELVAMGVKTILSVDGARPDVEAATRHGLQYVHLPHGYDGISERRAWELAKAVRDLEGPIYIHCHHGKHRSPAAAAVACVAARMLKPGDDARAVLQLAGTNPHYRGLYAAAEGARPLDAAALDALPVEFHSSVEPPPMAQAMVAIEHVHDRLQTMAAAGWKPPINQPDLDPALQALLLREHFTELLRTEDAATPSTQPNAIAWERRREPSKARERFLDLLREAEQLAQGLEESLRADGNDAHAGEPFPLETPPKRFAAQASTAQLWERVTANCTACHAEFRDVPLAKKR